MHNSERKSEYKLPPTVIRDKLISQEARRAKALEDQKRRRAQRIDSTRQLDILADLSLGISDDEDIEDEKAGPAQALDLASVAAYVPLLGSETTPNAITNSDQTFPIDTQGMSQPRKKKRRGNRKRSNKPSKWADKCMYAELLEMYPDEPRYGEDGTVSDGLPDDLETGWVAISPVPAGKRCLAVTHQSSGVGGIVPNTILKSRLLGKTLIQKFPSSLPPLTVLDCILDTNWRENGILHVLDVIRWKGQDIGDCEARFRFWWRDTRLDELPPTLPPSSNHATHFVPSENEGQLKYRFPYPTTLLPIPFHSNTTLDLLLNAIIPAARSERVIQINVPVLYKPDEGVGEGGGEGGDMDVEPFSNDNNPAFQFTFNVSAPNLPPPKTSDSGHVQTFLSQQHAVLHPDGLLLYVAHASFEPGTSPLSSWVPIALDNARPLDFFQMLVSRKAGQLMSIEMIC